MIYLRGLYVIIERPENERLFGRVIQEDEQQLYIVFFRSLDRKETFRVVLPRELLSLSVHFYADREEHILAMEPANVRL